MSFAILELKIFRVLLSLSRALSIRARARTQAKGLSLPRVKKFLRHIPRLAMKIVAPRRRQQKFLKRWMKAHSRIEVCRYNIRVSCYTDRLDRKVPIGLDSCADLAWDIWFHALRDIIRSRSITITITVSERKPFKDTSEQMVWVSNIRQKRRCRD